MTAPTFGVIFNRDDTDPRPAVFSDLSVLGLVLPSDDADATAFPLDVAVDVNTSDAAMLAKAGTGPLYQTLAAINDNLAEFEIAARAVVVRVATGANIDATIANIVGDPATGAGLYALLRAGERLGVIPRLIAAPGFTGRTRNGLLGGLVTAAGSGGADGTFALAFTGGAGTGGAGTFTVLDGAVISIALTNPGSYTAAPTPSFTASAGLTGAAGTLSIGLVANPICAALPGLCNTLLAHAVVGGPGSGKADAINWRETLNSSRLIPADAWVVVADGVGTREEDGIARILGQAVATDFEHGGVPSYSWANRPVQGILGLKNYYSFSLTDGATEGQQLLAANIGVIERGELGVETAVANSGFVFVGTENAGDDPIWQFYNVTRLRDYTHLALLRSIRRRLGRTNVTPHGVQAVINDMGAVLAALKAGEHIIDYRVGFEASKNTPENLRLGKIRLFFKSEEPAPFVQATIDSRRYREAIVEEIQVLAAQADSLVARA